MPNAALTTQQTSEASIGRARLGDCNSSRNLGCHKLYKRLLLSRYMPRTLVQEYASVLVTVGVGLYYPARANHVPEMVDANHQKLTSANTPYGVARIVGWRH
jgi:hypothetical protein